MKSGKFLFLAIIFLVSLVCISAVSAADEAVSDVIADTNDDVSNENLALEESDENILKDDGEEFSQPSPNPPMIGYFGLLNQTVNNGSDEVDLKYDYNYIEEDHDFQDGIRIDHNVTINGNGRTISGSTQAAIFYIPPGVSVVLKNITFTNAKTLFNGGAVYVDEGANCTIVNCVFSNNNAEHGGAVYVNVDGNCTIVNCAFSNNNAEYGGAVAVNDYGNCTIENSSFSNNSAVYGGAVYSNGYGNCTATDCSFVNNEAEIYGGGICVSESNGDCTAINCSFTSNKAGEFSGGMDFGTAIDCNFTKNYAQSAGAKYGGTSIGCIFKENSAQNGGALIEGEAYNCIFIDNVAKNASDDVIDLANEENCKYIHHTAITASAVTTTYNVNKYLTITLKDIYGRALSGVSVTVTLGSAKTYKTNKNGQIKINVAKLLPKAYTAKITFAGNSIYAATTKSVKVTVKKATPKMTAKAKTFKVGVKTKKYTITLKNNVKNALKKVKVTLKVNKKTFKATTNSKGVATFKITNLKKKGKYTAVIKYAGSKYYNKLTKKAKITVK